MWKELPVVIIKAAALPKQMNTKTLTLTITDITCICFVVFAAALATANGDLINGKKKESAK